MLEPINYVFAPVEYRGVCSGYEYKSIEVAIVHNGEQPPYLEKSCDGIIRVFSFRSSIIARSTPRVLTL